MSNDSIDFGFLADEVVKRVDILEEAEKQGLRFRRHGKSYFTLCPFHSERTPSFSINRNKKMFRCFACGKGGNVIVLLAALRGVSKGKVIYHYSKKLGLIGASWSRKQQQEIKQRTIQYEFKRKEESNFDEVFRFLCDQVHAYRRAMKQVKTIKDRNALQKFYQIYDQLPYYEYLLQDMSGDNGEDAQVEAYFVGEEKMDEWNSRINS
ncbi:CHC2 zinc finger domain-containing protein [Neobacillus sp. YX16]|uniref:CHC2 zinc finger domain-containing protein n=1 Tax=Neobacillus sp. YX16 TaxID=3047874 RepID=UPI0024C2E10C|nr:CHC2 zinc finger domain-containing protein [Neobacillus sp. YX16]WHZ04960.1 CHC2 zinc finger domain-containing protein [Neobacillus sp. YX16]